MGTDQHCGDILRYDQYRPTLKEAMTRRQSVDTVTYEIGATQCHDKKV